MIFELGPNQPQCFYSGSGKIANFREPELDPDHNHAFDLFPEDWIASTVTQFGRSTSGLTVLEDGRFLRDAIDADPQWWVGPEYASRGPLAVPLVKLLDTGRRIPVHSHPDDDFARTVLGMSNGKTEAWIVLQASDGAAVHVGWKENVSEERLQDLADRQDTASFFDAMHRVEVVPGDTLLVPAGIPHSVGEDMLVLEVQQPADASVLIEWDGYAHGTADDSYLGLERATALGSVNRQATTKEELVRWGRHEVFAAPSGSRLVAAESEPFFTSQLLHGPASVSSGYAVGIGIAGEGTVLSGKAQLKVARGSIFIIPHAAGEWMLDGDATVALFGCGISPDQSAGATF